MWEGGKEKGLDRWNKGNEKEKGLERYNKRNVRRKEEGFKEDKTIKWNV